MLKFTSKDFRQYMHSRVIITTVKDSKYLGVLEGVRSNTICLTKLVGLHKDGTYKFVSGNQSLNKRWFNMDSIRSIELSIPVEQNERYCDLCYGTELIYNDDNELVPCYICIAFRRDVE